MARNLSLFPFNNRANIATSGVGWYVEAGVVVDALAGDDKITGTVTSLDGIGDGINNVGAINTGEGDDTIMGTSIGDDGIDNEGIINTGKGNDTITGSSYEFGLSNEGTINTGKGNDTITGTSIGSHGIDNVGTINTGKGDDTITGTSIGDDGIYNVGTINTGEGNDLVNALKGGFGGNGSTFLGGNNDTLKGFGTGSFYGGTGIDKILFGQGTYTVSGTTIVSDGVTMNVNEFETIGGANEGLFAFKDGTLIVDSGGVGTFA